MFRKIVLIEIKAQASFWKLASFPVGPAPGAGR